MPFYTGRTGSLTIGSPSPVKTMAKIRDWSLSTTVELLNTNAIDSAVSTYVPGVKSATGSATLMYYRLESGEDATRQQFTDAITKLVKIGAVTTDDRVRIVLNVGSNEKDDIVFNAYITSAEISVSTGELSVIPIQFTVDGDFSQVITA